MLRKVPVSAIMKKAKGGTQVASHLLLLEASTYVKLHQICSYGVKGYRKGSTRFMCVTQTWFVWVVGGEVICMLWTAQDL